MIAAGTVYFLSNLATNDALDLVYLAHAKASERLGETGRRAARIVFDAPADRLPAALREATITIEENARVGKEGVASVLWFNGNQEIRRSVTKTNAQLSALSSVLLEEVKADAAARLGRAVPALTVAVDSRVPVRLTRGPLDFGLPESKLPRGDGTAGAPRYQLGGDVRFEIPNFIDGKRNISEIERALIGEFGSSAIAGCDKFIEDLVKVGVVKWK